MQPLINQDIAALAADLIAGQNTMTLATAALNVPWAAPVYYVNHDFQFYFFSDPKSRHIMESQEQRLVSAAIYAQAATWREIRGIQMSGSIEIMHPGFEAVKAVRRYLKKFPFTSEFFEEKEELDLGAFIKRFKVRLYKFRPEILFYLDNSIKFGFREKVPL